MPSIPNKSFHCCPYGGLASISCVLGLIATIFSYVACFGCSLLETNRNGMDGRLGYYFYSLMDTPTCASILTFPGAFPVDGYWRVGRGTATVLTFFGFSNFVHLCLLTCCVRLPRLYVRGLGIVMLFTGILHPLLFVGLQSKFCTLYRCTTGSGSILAIVAMCSWFVVGCMMFYLQERITNHDIEEAAAATEALQQQQQQQELVQQQLVQQLQQQEWLQQQLLQQQAQQQYHQQQQEQPQQCVQQDATNPNQTQQHIISVPIPSSVHPGDIHNGPISVEMTETPQPDGTFSRTTTVTRTNPDGSKTVQVTTETNIIPSTMISKPTEAAAAAPSTASSSSAATTTATSEITTSTAIVGTAPPLEASAPPGSPPIATQLNNDVATTSNPNSATTPTTTTTTTTDDDIDKTTTYR